MSGELGIFFCDLDSTQEGHARDWSLTNKGVLYSDKNLKPEPLSLITPDAKVKPDAYIEIDLESNLEKSPIDPLTEDLIACACHIYQADRMMLRPRHSWHRRMEFHIGVNNKQLYQSVAGEIGRIIGYLTQDQITVQFYQLNAARQTLGLPKPVRNPDGGVCVFSDNIDSMAGVATVNQATNILASFQYGPEKPRFNQMRLIEKIEKVTNNLGYIGLKIMPRRIKGRDITQRSRGFLQLSLAAAIARHSGLQRIQVFGNGFSSYHLRNRQICGPGFAVRDTYPIFLRDVLDLFTGLNVAEKLAITNPFQFSTPNDVLGILLHLLPDCAQELFSCTDNCLEHKMAKELRKWNSQAIPHCGCCFPCKIRRLAALKMQLETEQDYGAYSINPMGKKVSSRSTKKLGSHLRDRLQQFHIKGLQEFRTYLEIFKGDPQIILQVPEIGEQIRKMSTVKLDFTRNRKDADDVRNGIIEVHHRFAEEALGYFP